MPVKWQAASASTDGSRPDVDGGGYAWSNTAAWHPVGDALDRRPSCKALLAQELSTSAQDRDDESASVGSELADYSNVIADFMEEAKTGRSTAAYFVQKARGDMTEALQLYSQSTEL